MAQQRSKLNSRVDPRREKIVKSEVEEVENLPDFGESDSSDEDVVPVPRQEFKAEAPKASDLIREAREKRGMVVTPPEEKKMEHSTPDAPAVE